MFFAHGTNHSCGVMILVRNDLEFEEDSCVCDQNGRSIISKATVQGAKYVLAYIYAPNKVHQQCTFLKNLLETLDSNISSPVQRLIIGGDFNVTFDSNLDCSGGSPVLKESVKMLEEICLDLDLIDIWTVRNRDKKLFTWKQTGP